MFLIRRSIKGRRFFFLISPSLALRDPEQRVVTSVRCKLSALNDEGKRMPKKKLLKKHSVRANLHVVELTRAGSSLDLEIYADNEKIGTMIIGRGSLVWFGGKRQLRKRIPWSRFAEMMDELAYGSRH